MIYDLRFFELWVVVKVPFRSNFHKDNYKTVDVKMTHLVILLKCYLKI